MRLSLEGVHVRRGPHVVLSGLDFVVDGGEIVGIVGGNGAGKSTMVAAVAGLLVPHRGAIRFDGRRVEGSSPQAMVKRGICLVPQGRRVFHRLSVLRNIELGGFVRRRGTDVQARAVPFSTVTRGSPPVATWRPVLCREASRAWSCSDAP